MKSLLLIIFVLIVFLFHDSVIACTSFTSSNDTLVLVGNNEDNYFSDPQLLLVPPSANNYGYVCFGFQVEPSYWHAFGAVNDQGLFHDAFTVPTLPVTSTQNNPYYNGNLAVLAMEQCATVQEVVALYYQYNLSFLNIEQHFFVDRTGASVIIEGDTVIYNNGDPQAITSFRFSNPSFGYWPCWRYENAISMINNNQEVSVDHYRTILDQVHLNSYYWETKYSNICDLKNNIIYLFIDHNYEQVAEIHIDQALTYGYNLVYMSELQFYIIPPILPDLVNPTFDQGILLVNGLSWDGISDSTHIKSSYKSKAFWGDYPITFWECSNPPSNGYPTTLPNPIGQGEILPDILGQFSTVIWISNFNGTDIVNWRSTPILNYLEAGGNLIFISRAAQLFIDGDIQEYLGITWGGHYGYVDINICNSVYPGLNGMLKVLQQTKNALFETNLPDTSRHLLFQDSSSNVPNGIGVWYKPENGGIYNNTGGQFVYIAGSPYKYNANHLRLNISYILENFFHETLTTDINYNTNNTVINNNVLLDNYPNPFNPTTKIKYEIFEKGKVTITIFDITGREVKTLVNQTQTPGEKIVEWNGDDNSNKSVSSGIYIYQMQTGESNHYLQSRKMILLR